MKKKVAALFVVGVMAASMASAMPAYAGETEASVPEAPDYSRAECWYQIPEITRDVDTFYIPATEYVASSFEISRQAHHKCPPCFFPARETVSRQEGGMVGFF